MSSSPRLLLLGMGSIILVFLIAAFLAIYLPMVLGDLDTARAKRNLEISPQEVNVGTDALVLFVMGQSNAKGSGETQVATGTLNNVFTLGLGSTTFEPFQVSKRNWAYVDGLSQASFQNELAKLWASKSLAEPGSLPPLYIVTVAKGSEGTFDGTLLNSWATGRFLTTMSLDAIEITKTAIAALNKRLLFAGTVWLQGETDASTSAQPAGYGARFQELYDGWVDFWSKQHCIWFAKLLTGTKPQSNLNLVNGAFQSFIDASNGQAFLLDASQNKDRKGSIFKSDNVHYTGETFSYFASEVLRQMLTHECTRIIPVSTKAFSPLGAIYPPASLNAESELVGTVLSGYGNPPFGFEIETSGGNTIISPDVSDTNVGGILSLLPMGKLRPDAVDVYATMKLPQGDLPRFGFYARAQRYSADTGHRNVQWSYLSLISTGSLIQSRVSTNTQVTLNNAAFAWGTLPASDYWVRFIISGAPATTRFQIEFSADNFLTAGTSVYDFTGDTTTDGGNASGEFGLVFGTASAEAVVDAIEIISYESTVTSP